MPRLSTEKINEIRQSVDIVDVIGSYLSLEKKGRNYRALCPFHEDSDPSLMISQDKQIYRCFVCNHGGNVFQFLQDYLKISFIEAVKIVAEMGQVDLGDYTFYEKKTQVNQELEPFYQMQDEASRIYRHYLGTRLAILAKDYLIDRGITQDIIDRFEIGYAPKENILLQAFEKSGFTKMQAYESGLVIESNVGYDRYHDRIMFPLHNSEGRTVGFSGRVYLKNSQEAKYINSPESKIFIKGQTLYNYHRVKEIVRQSGKVIVLEGFMDVIALYKAGIENAIAIMGTAFTKDHMHMLNRLTKNIVLCLDGDMPGQRAMANCIDDLTKQGFNVSVVVIPEGKDPDEYLNAYGKEALRSLYQKPVSAIEFLMDHYYRLTNIDNYEERKDYVLKMSKIISTLEDQIDRIYYRDMLEKKSGFSKDIIDSLLRQNEVVRPERPVRQVIQKKRGFEDKYQKAEKELLYYMMNDKKYASIYEAKAGYMFDHIHRIIASYIIDHYRKYPTLHIADLISVIDDDKIKETIIDIASYHLPVLENDKAIYDYIDVIQEKMKIERMKILENDLKNTIDDIQKSKIALEIIALKKEINALKEKG